MMTEEVEKPEENKEMEEKGGKEEQEEEIDEVKEKGQDKETEKNSVQKEKKSSKHKRKLRILMRERGFQRCKNCRGINPLDAEKCLNCGEPLFKEEEKNEEDIQKDEN